MTLVTAAHGEEGLADRLAAARDYLHGSNDAVRGRYGRACRGACARRGGSPSARTW